jgi:hypothetical protein
MTIPNRYPDKCKDCGKAVARGAGFASRGPGRWDKWTVRCASCQTKAEANKDHSGIEDRCCGDAAYEDACARACGF